MVEVNGVVGTGVHDDVIVGVADLVGELEGVGDAVRVNEGVLVPVYEGVSVLLDV